MLSLRLFLTVPCIFLMLLSFGQDKYSLAKELKQKYPEEVAVITNSKTVIEFQKKGKKMVAVESTDESFLGLKKNQRYDYPVFYSEFIDLIEIDAKGGHPFRGGPYTVEGIFHNDVKVGGANYNISKFGSEASLHAKIMYNDLRYLTSAYLTNYYNVTNREIEFIIPDNVKVELIPMNFENYDVQETTEYNGSKKIIRYKIEDLAKFSEEENTPGHSHIYPHILIRVLSYETKQGTTTLFDTVDDLYAWYIELVNDIDDKQDTLKPLVEEIIKNQESDYDKISSIYYWVQDNIRYLAFEDGIAGFKPASCQKVYVDRYGDCKGMSNLTKNMLILAGYDARLAWIGTRKIAYDYSMPSLIVDNHVICAVNIDGKFYYLDPTIKHLSFNKVHQGIQGKSTIIENGESHLLEQLPMTNAEDNRIKYLLKLNPGPSNQLNGSLTMELTGEAKILFLNGINSVGSKNKEIILKRYLANFNKQILVSEVNIEGSERDEKLVVTSEVVISDKVSSIENQLFVYPDPLQLFSNRGIESDRDQPYWFDFKREIELIVDIVLPEGYRVESLPQGFTSTNESYSFDVSVNHANREVRYHFGNSVSNAELLVEDFPGWNQNINELKDFYRHPIILNRNE